MSGGNASEIKQGSGLIYEVYAIPNVICSVQRSAKEVDIPSKARSNVTRKKKCHEKKVGHGGPVYGFHTGTLFEDFKVDNGREARL